MALLTPRFSANRMLTEYVERLYAPAAATLRGREASGFEKAGALADWERSLRGHWPAIEIGALESRQHDGRLCVSVAVTLGAIDAGSVLVELYADPVGDEPAVRAPMERRESLPGLANGARYQLELRTARPPWHFTARALPSRDGVSIPSELPLIAWGRR